MRRILTLLLSLTLLAPNYAFAYQNIDLKNSPCEPWIDNCVPETNSANPIRAMAEKSIREYLPNLSYKDNPVIEKFRYFIEPGLDPLYKEYVKAALGVSYEFWGKKIVNPSSIIIATKSEFYKDSLCATYYQIDKVSFEKCQSSPLSDFGSWWPENDNPNSFGAVFNYISEVDSKGKVRTDYPAIFIFLSQEQKNRTAPQRDILRTLIHEITHLSQWGFESQNDPSKLSQNRFSANSPLLFTEGSAQYLGTALAHIYFNGGYNLSFPANAKWVGESFNPDVYSLVNQNRAEAYKNNNLSNLYYSGGLMTEIFIAHFGVKRFLELNTCLTYSSQNVDRSFERCFTTITGASFKEWSAEASKYIQSVFNNQEIKIEDYDLQNISKAPLSDLYQIESSVARQGEVVFKLSIKDYGIKEVKSIILQKADGKALCEPLKSNLFCVVNNDELTNETTLYITNESGLKSEVVVPNLLEPLPSVVNLEGSIDNSSNYNQGTSGLDNTLVRIAWDQVESYTQSNNQQNPSSYTGGVPSEAGTSNNESNSSKTGPSAQSVTQEVSGEPRTYQISLLGCLNEKGEAVVKDLVVKNLSVQIPCLTAFTKLSDGLKVGVRELSNQGVGRWANLVINPGSERDLLPVLSGLVIVKNKDASITLKYKKNTKRDLELKALITKFNKGKVVSNSLIFLDESKSKYQLGEILNNISGQYQIEVIARAKGEDNFSYGVAYKSKPLTLNYKAVVLPKTVSSNSSPNSNSAVSVENKAPVVTPTEKNGLITYPITTPKATASTVKPKPSTSPVKPKPSATPTKSKSTIKK